MWRAVLTFLLKFILARLGEDLEASERAAVADYEARRSELDKREEAAGIELARIEQQIREYNTAREKLRIEAVQLDNLLKRQQQSLHDVNEKHKTDSGQLASSSDTDVLRSEI
ncbi:MAG: hypothetical protein IT171_04140 [Acidobacteria bacterium]|nr:hypothetical protein [Acidobacteriota bacterium]